MGLSAERLHKSPEAGVTVSAAVPCRLISAQWLLANEIICQNLTSSPFSADARPQSKKGFSSFCFRGAAWLPLGKRWVLLPPPPSPPLPRTDAFILWLHTIVMLMSHWDLRVIRHSVVPASVLDQVCQCTQRARAHMLSCRRSHWSAQVGCYVKKKKNNSHSNCSRWKY